MVSNLFDMTAHEKGYSRNQSSSLTQITILLLQSHTYVPFGNTSAKMVIYLLTTNTFEPNQIITSFCEVFWPLSVLCHLAIVYSMLLPFTASEYPCYIFKPVYNKTKITHKYGIEFCERFQLRYLRQVCVFTLLYQPSSLLPRICAVLIIHLIIKELYNDDSSFCLGFCFAL